MFLSFGGVILIAFSYSIKGAATEETTDVSTNKQILGSGLILLASWTYATVTLMTRQMQHVNFAVILFYYGVVASILSLLMVVFESLVKHEPIRFWEYSGEQYGYTLLLSAVNYFGMNCQTIALQNEKSGFVTLLGYIGLVYAFFGDLFIFKESLAWVELLGILIVLVLNITLICNKI